MGDEEYIFHDSNITLDQLINRMRGWINEEGFSSEVSYEEGWQVLKVTKGAALWKGKLKFYLTGDRNEFKVRVESGSKGKAYLKGGILGAGLQKKVNNLKKGFIQEVERVSNARRGPKPVQNPPQQGQPPQQNRPINQKQRTQPARNRNPTPNQNNNQPARNSPPTPNKKEDYQSDRSSSNKDDYDKKLEKLEKLGRLRDIGAITEEEFRMEKKKILDEKNRGGY